MKIKKINPEIINKPIVYEYFIGNPEVEEEQIFLDDYYEIDCVPFFPIYIAERDEALRKLKFIEAFECMRDNYLELGRDLLMDKSFWYSLFVDRFKDEIKRIYPKSLESEKDFRNIVFKKFDWENYVYKIILGSEYIVDQVKDNQEHHRYFDLITENLDIYNYTLKSELFKNSSFLKNLLDVIDKTDLSTIAKKRIDLGTNKDERVGRRIINEFSKSYPVVFVHALEYEEFKEHFLKYAGIYADIEVV